MAMARRPPWPSSFINIGRIKESFYAVTSLSARCEPAHSLLSPSHLETWRLILSSPSQVRVRETSSKFKSFSPKESCGSETQPCCTGVEAGGIP